jgi:cellulose synthase/poly-beta-1,6-N-acetylglucosamine synthase-like glycosyltransferase
MFQSKIWNWNGEGKFAGLLARLVPLRFYAVYKLSNHLDTIMSWGHNNLVRTSALLEVGGFDASYVGEDFATALNLIAHGWACKMVDLVSYDAEVESVRAYRKRTLRYAKQTLQIALSGTRPVPLLANLHVFISSYFFLVWIVYMIGKLVVVWGYRSSFDDYWRLARLVSSGNLVHSGILPGLLLAGFYTFQLVLARLPIAWRLGIGTNDYLWHMFVYMAIHYYLMFPLVWEQLKTLLGGEVQFTVTKPRESVCDMSLRQIAGDMRWTLLFGAVIALGLVRNPLALLFNFVWIVPLLLSPIVIYSISRAAQPSAGTKAASLAVQEIP